jgi:bifunctional DNase/RNase
VSLESLAAAYPDVPWEPVRSRSASPDGVFEEAEQARVLQQAIEPLPPSLGHVVALHYLDEFNYAEVVAALDVPVSTVKGRLFKSRRKLWRELAAAGVLPQRQQSRQKGAVQAVAGRKKDAGEQAPAGPALVEMLIDSIRQHLQYPDRVVWLKEKGGERFLSIVVGAPEADAIAVELQDRELPRALTHVLLLSAFGALNASVTRVVVTELRDETFYALVCLVADGREVEIDARPSDALALAVRANVPTYVAEPVLAKGATAARPGDTPTGLTVPSLPPLTERAQKVAALAVAEARRFSHETLGSEHLVLGLLREGESQTARILIEMGAQLSAARRAVAELAGFGEQPAPPGRPPELRNRELPHLIADQAGQLGHTYVGTEHLLIGTAGRGGWGQPAGAGAPGHRRGGLAPARENGAE